MAEPERWLLTEMDRQHVVAIADGGWRRTITWAVDGAEVARASTSDDRVALCPKDSGEDDAGHLRDLAVAVRLPALRGPARRVTLFTGRDGVSAAVVARTGLGGVDLVPEPGSAAARREQWIRDHPNLYTTQRTMTAVGKVLGSLLLAWLAARFAFSLPWPAITLPRIPWPDVPWPDLRLPRIPWPQIDLPQLPDPPDWLVWMAEHAKYVWPVVLAALLARTELRRRRRQEERRAVTAGSGDASQQPTGPAEGTSEVGTPPTDATPAPSRRSGGTRAR